jgi:hypothetical protein
MKLVLEALSEERLNIGRKLVDAEVALFDERRTMSDADFVASLERLFAVRERLREIKKLSTALAQLAATEP